MSNFYLLKKIICNPLIFWKEVGFSNNLNISNNGEKDTVLSHKLVYLLLKVKILMNLRQKLFILKCVMVLSLLRMIPPNNILFELIVVVNIIIFILIVRMKRIFGSELFPNKLFPQILKYTKKKNLNPLQMIMKIKKLLIKHFFRIFKVFYFFF